MDNETQVATRPNDPLETGLPTKLKVCGYRPYRIIGRDPSESTYKVGDDKFCAVLYPSGNLDFQAKVAARVIELWNARVSPVSKGESGTGVSVPANAEVIAAIRELLEIARELCDGREGDAEGQFGKWDRLIESLECATPLTHTGSDSKDLREREVREQEEELIAKCIEAILNEGRASTSLLQRRFRLGYSRAAAIMDMLEVRGIVGPGEGAKPRAVLAQRVPLISSNATQPVASHSEPKAESPQTHHLVDGRCVHCNQHVIFCTPAPAASPWIREDTMKLICEEFIHVCQSLTDSGYFMRPETQEAFDAARGLPIPEQLSPWIRTAERKPTKEDATNNTGEVLCVNHEWSFETYGWEGVAMYPNLWPFWMPIPALPAQKEKEV